MKFITDFHIHSHYSVATSKHLVPEYLEYWARLKGINVIGTGDCIHPGWLDELKKKFVLCDNGLYCLKDEYRLNESKRLKLPNMPETVFFMLTGELSSIYKKHDKVRKVHNVVVFPDFDAAEQVQHRLDEIGNIRSDGRPILGLDSKIILDMTLESSPTSFLIPAHIWTPWFSVLGSKSGFNNLEECYEDLTQYIFAVETGLSSDPAMNWSCSFLDRFKLVSNSDAHSPEKLGREANIFDTELSYRAIYNALKEPDNDGFTGTIEFYPEEGKYHYDGHRKCNVRWDPLETLRHGGICNVCGKPVTKGVLYRVAELADRTDITQAPFYGEYHSITQLPDLLAEYLNKKNFKTKAVMQMYHTLLEQVGPEFYTLLFAPEDELQHAAGDIVAGGIQRLRKGNVFIDEGYDGEFGTIKVFTGDEINNATTNTLFSFDMPDKTEAYPVKDYYSMAFDVEEFQRLLKQQNHKVGKQDAEPEQRKNVTGNEGQENAIKHGEGPCLVVAGPGSGKTYVLTRRVAHLVNEDKIDPGSVLALTFSNRAADEMGSRLRSLLGESSVTVSTFHAFGLSLLKQHHDLLGRNKDFYITDHDEQLAIIEQLTGEKRKAKGLLKKISLAKQGAIDTEDTDINGELFDSYNTILRENNSFDIDDLVYQVVYLLRSAAEVTKTINNTFSHILVDEFQDINGVQYDLIRLLAPNTGSDLFVIGDPDQSIYGFRGSDVHYLEQLKEDYPDIKSITLSHSYRCPDYIVKAASQVLQKKQGLTGTDRELKVTIMDMTSDRSEADWIAVTIEKQMGGVRSFSIDSGISDGESNNRDSSFSDYAVLCRSAFMFDAVIEAFTNHGIAYQVVGTDPFYTKEPFLTPLTALKQFYYKQTDSLFSQNVHEDIHEMLEKGDPVSDILKFLLVINDATEYQIGTMSRFAEPYKNNYHRFFRDLATRQGSDDYSGKLEAVTIMTLHASKGLEFNTVFIPGCETGIIPFELFRNMDDAEKKEEERLLYVGITRTQQQLYLSHAAKRSYRGRILQSGRSPFLDRLEKELLYEKKRSVFPKKQKEEGQLNLF